MNFNIEFSYQFDTQNFFTTEARAALEEAANIWEGYIDDDFVTFDAGQSVSVSNPQTGQSITTTINQDVDDLLIFVGARNLGGPLGIATTATNASGDENRLRVTDDFRGQGPSTNYEPYTGSIAFDQGVNWSYNLGGSASNEFDFITVALHEIGHILGISINSGAFTAFVNGDEFTGPNTMAANNGQPIPLESSANLHVEEGFENNTVLLDPTISPGTRILPSSIDLALLADIGYEIDGFTAQGSTFDLATSGAETIFGRDISDTINGLDGDDQIQGDDGDDFLRGGGGTNTMFGQDGLDSFYFSPGDGQSQIADFDFQNENIVVDPAFGFTSKAEVLALVTSPFSNVREIDFGGGESAFIFTNSTGSQLTEANIEFGVLPPVDSVIEGTPQDDILDGTEIGETISGLAGADTLNGLGGDDILIGGAGADILNGGIGADTMEGGAGNDIYIVDNAGDVIDESVAGSTGFDIVRSSVTANFGTANFNGGIEALTLTGSSDVNAIGNLLNNIMTGNNASNVLNGQGGADNMRGRGGNDTYVVDNANDFISESIAGSTGFDRVLSSVTMNLSNTAQVGGAIERIELTGAGNINAVGNLIANGIFGNSGNNVINGLGGSDNLTGGGGADSFVFTTALGIGESGNVDTINDFTVGTDRMLLDDAIFGSLSTGALSAVNFRELSTGPRDANDFILYSQANGTVFYDSDGSGAAAAQLFAIVDPGTALSASDFFVI